MSRQFAILGLGYFGSTVARELKRHQNQILGVDRDESRVDALSDMLDHAVIADLTDEKALAELSLETYDAVVIDVDGNLEASVICTLHVKELGAKEIWAKAHSDAHYKLLKRLGADRVIYPEYDAGIRVAESLNYHAMVDFIRLGERQFIVEVETTERLVDNCKSVAKLAIDRDSLFLVAIKRGEEVIQNPSNDTTLQAGDNLVLMGDLDALREIGKQI
ncbi:TrkA family potassium uptake protein [Salinicola endophyticus]|uniref:TrkA family potassium uptake protein n=1 Tax=Salinicola endophyticus TaxID=1949083 RepID=A0ABY8FN14_9GAMM|nr:TrkA family potassium uptake protein [Salinicola endophyticus]WFF42591.1 TrkA family potassium uptake protein [Salinicola endophyticus]